MIYNIPIVHIDPIRHNAKIFNTDSWISVKAFDDDDNNNVLQIYNDE